MAANPELSTMISTVAEGRSRDLRYRQRQFLSLHNWIDSHATDIADALGKDDGQSPSEARFVISAVLNELQQHYDGLDLQRELGVEFSIKKGKENPDRRVAEDLVYLIASKSSLFFSVLSVLCASVAAGSCLMVELPSDLRYSPSILHRLFSESLDRRAFMVAGSRPSESFLRSCLVVDQANILSPNACGSILTSDAQVRAVAIVDRSADLDLAAQEIAASRSFMGGQGCYAPDFILVNEFAQVEFLKALSKHCPGLNHAHLANGEPHVNGSASTSTHINGSGTVKMSGSKPLDFSAKGQKQHAGMASKGLQLNEVHKRQDLNFNKARQASTMALLAYTSLEDAIDSVATAQQNPLPALYVFAGPAPAKYLAHFIKTHVSFVNHIPANLLVGPAAPCGYPVSTALRYRREMFESPSPQFIAVAANELRAADVVQAESVTSRRWHQAARHPLKPTGQPREGDVNFFVQGLRAALVVYVLPVILMGLVGTGFVGKKAISHFKLR